jgi:hypothetical protein
LSTKKAQIQTSFKSMWRERRRSDTLAGAFLMSGDGKGSLLLFEPLSCVYHVTAKWTASSERASAKRLHSWPGTEESKSNEINTAKCTLRPSSPFYLLLQIEAATGNKVQHLLPIGPPAPHIHDASIHPSIDFHLLPFAKETNFLPGNSLHLLSKIFQNAAIEWVHGSGWIIADFVLDMRRFFHVKGIQFCSYGFGAILKMKIHPFFWQMLFYSLSLCTTKSVILPLKCVR